MSQPLIALLLLFLSFTMFVQWIIMKDGRGRSEHLVSWRPLALSPNPSDPFKTSTVLVWNEYDQTIPITVRQVTISNKHRIPPFERVHFEFYSLSQSDFFRNDRFSKNQYHEMLRRMHSQIRNERIGTKSNLDPLLMEIINEFGYRHALDLKVAYSQITSYSVNGLSAGTAIHFDGTPPDFRLWIPLTDSLIDNLSLGVGDVTTLTNTVCASPSAADAMDECADGHEFAETLWYQQMTMSSEDWIFWDTGKVPHYSVHLGDSRKTRTRTALVINIERRKRALLSMRYSH